MKKILFFTTLIISSICNAQNIEESRIDDFTGERVIYTSFETLKKATSLKNNKEIRYRFFYENNTQVMNLMISFIGNNEVYSCDKGSKILFKTNNGTNELFVLKYAISGIGEAATRFAASKANGINIKCTGNLAFLENEQIEKIRIIFNKGYIDFDIKEQYSDIVNKTYHLFLQEINAR